MKTRYASGLWAGGWYQPDIGHHSLWNLRLEFIGDRVEGSFIDFQGPSPFGGICDRNGWVWLTSNRRGYKDFYLGKPDGEGGIRGEWIMDLRDNWLAAENYRNHGYFALHPLPIEGLTRTGVETVREKLRPRPPELPCVLEVWRLYSRLGSIVDQLRASACAAADSIEQIVLEVQAREAEMRCHIGARPFVCGPRPVLEVADLLPPGFRLGLTREQFQALLVPFGEESVVMGRVLDASSPKGSPAPCLDSR